MPFQYRKLWLKYTEGTPLFFCEFSVIQVFKRRGKYPGCCNRRTFANIKRSIEMMEKIQRFGVSNSEIQKSEKLMLIQFFGIFAYQSLNASIKINNIISEITVASESCLSEPFK